MTAWLPGVGVLRGYRREWLRADIVAGFVLAALLLPQGMAYAQLAGMPPVTGIYATMVPMVVYALVGPSRILVVGPDSAVGPLVAAALLSMASNPAQSVELGSLLALLVGGVGWRRDRFGTPGSANGSCGRSHVIRPCVYRSKGVMSAAGTEAAIVIRGRPRLAEGGARSFRSGWLTSTLGQTSSSHQ